MANHVLNTYNQLPISFVRGEGVWLFDESGNKYLDAYGGIAVSVLGHNHPAVTKAITDQATKIIHVSNLVEIPQQIELSNILADLTGFDAKVFFCNSGAEAIETALKLARLYGHSKNIDNPKTIVMGGAFHGRTLAALSAGGNVKTQAGFEPLVPGFVRVEFNNPDAIEAALQADKDIVAVLVEPIQGESGVNVPSLDFLTKVRALCDKYQVLMLVDEVQTGMGRTGKFFCHEFNKIQPDAITLAKGLANGVPIGACIIRAPLCDLFKPGSHGSTFGGNPFSCAVAIATVNEIKKHKLYENAAKQGKLLLDGLRANLKDHPNVVDIRGQGLMVGVQLDRECRAVLPLALKHGVVFNVANYNTLRLLPALIINKQEIQQIVEIIPVLINEFINGAA